MSLTRPAGSRVLLTAAVAAFVAAHLGWEQFDGGVRSHHLLARADLPAISNAWGLLVLPVLAWLALGRMQARSAGGAFGIDPGLWRRLLAATLYGASMAASFAFDLAGVTSAMFQGLFVLAVLMPLYRSEYVLGFVLGMTLTFGAVLPTLVAAVLASVSLVLQPAARYLVSVAARRLGHAPP